MGAACCHDTHSHSAPPVDPRFRKALWIALIVNAAMFLVEVVSGLGADSVSLLADAADFLGDAANYALSLFVLALAPVWRSRAALAKGLSMGAYGLAVLALAGWNVWRGSEPNPATMGAVGFLALAANAGVAIMLYRFRDGEANMRSVWLCSRNDAIGNVAILIAALGVFGTGTAWPDLIVAAVMATLGLTASVAVVRQSRRELATAEGDARLPGSPSAAGR